MVDREKAIKGLEEFKADLKPYAGNSADWEKVDNALSLLKAQEPRVMTLEEVKGMKRLTICAVEQRSKVIKTTFNAEYGGIVTLGNENFLDFGLYGDTNRYRRSEAGYGKTWRCWTSRPSDSERKNTPWEN